MNVGRASEYYGSKAMMPDLTFFMDIPPEIGLERVAIRGDANKFEAKNMAFSSFTWFTNGHISHLLDLSILHQK